MKKLIACTMMLISASSFATPMRDLSPDSVTPIAGEFIRLNNEHKGVRGEYDGYGCPVKVCESSDRLSPKCTYESRDIHSPVCGMKVLDKETTELEFDRHGEVQCFKGKMAISPYVADSYVVHKPVVTTSYHSDEQKAFKECAYGFMKKLHAQPHYMKGDFCYFKKPADTYLTKEDYSFRWRALAEEFGTKSPCGFEKTSSEVFLKPDGCYIRTVWKSAIFPNNTKAVSEWAGEQEKCLEKYYSNLPLSDLSKLVSPKCDHE